MTAREMFETGHGLCLLGAFWYWWDPCMDEGRKATVEELKEAAEILNKAVAFNEALDKTTEALATELDIPKEMLT